VKDEVKLDKKLSTSTSERHEENQRTRNKMKSVRSQMERCSLLKEKKDQVNMIIDCPGYRTLVNVIINCPGYIHSFISVSHHYEYVAPNVDIILQSG